MVKGLLEIMHNYTKEYKDIEAMPDDLFVPFGNLYNIATEISNRFEQQVSLGVSQPVLLAEDSKEYKLWCEIVTDVTTYAGTDEGINIIEKIENLFGLDNTDNFNELEKKAVTHLNSLKNTWE